MFERWKYRKNTQLLKRSDVFIQRAKSRMPEYFQRQEMNINDMIASLTDWSNTPILTPQLRRFAEQVVSTYSFLRDTHGANTVGDALDNLLCRRVEPPTVLQWIREGRFAPPIDYSGETMEGFAVELGYPEFKTEIDQVKQQFSTRKVK